MKYVIQTAPLRSTRNWRGNSERVALKYVKVRADGKFDFVLDLNSATIFNDMPTLLQALGIRAVTLQKGKNYGQTAKITDELTVAEVEPGYVAPTPPPPAHTVTKVHNGHPKVGGARADYAPQRRW